MANLQELRLSVVNKTRKISIQWKDAINTKSNLKSDVFHEIVLTLGLDYTHFSTKEKLLDEKLLEEQKQHSNPTRSQLNGAPRGDFAFPPPLPPHQTAGMDERKRHGWAFWFAAVLIGLPLLYIGSYGPACWIASRLGRGYRPINVIFRPIIAVSFAGTPANKLLTWYSTLGAVDNTLVFDEQPDGSYRMVPGYSE